jgi:hypothetical protein
MKAAKTLIYVFVLAALLLATCSTASAMPLGATVAMAAADDNDCAQCINDFYAGAAWCFNTFDDPGVLGACLDAFLYSLNICLGFCELDMLSLNKPLPFADDEKPFAVLPSSRQWLFNSGYLASKWPPTASPVMMPRRVLFSS